MKRKDILAIIIIIQMVSKRYPKDKDVQLVCDALEKILLKVKTVE